MKTKQAPQIANPPAKEPPQQLAKRTNIYIAADDQGINISGLTNIEYLHLRHIIQKYVDSQPSVKYAGAIRDYQNEIEQTARTILLLSSIVY